MIVTVADSMSSATNTTLSASLSTRVGCIGCIGFSLPRWDGHGRPTMEGCTLVRSNRSRSS